MSRLKRVIKRLGFGLAILIAVALILPSALSAATLNGQAEVVDGDTIKIGGLPVRLQGIDAPEGLQRCEREGRKYPCGKEATKVLADLIKGRPVQCEIVGKG